ncbi:sensor histidine kinase [Neobacillus drentensis]|uniref:sensor histidine kinase n=1 Tax=Neobacillus drentensis TaxID=220684 RepID=UPI000824E524|nr:HAMP domain-containing sensor histidine kinase [Neobacillus drentensis]
MVTKWRSRTIFAAWTLLFTFGLSGLLAFFTYGSDYLHRDYFHTPQFQSELDAFAGYLSVFELYDLPLDEAKKAITVTKDEIIEHRYRYGNLPDQINNINAQYEAQIQEDLNTNNQEAADALTAERDLKIDDIKKNFKSDEYIRPKVIKEKEQRLEEYYKERENTRSVFLRYKDTFSYYYTNSATGKVHTNLNLPKDQSANDMMNPKNMRFVTNFQISRDYAINYGIPGYAGLINSIIPKTSGVFEGQIGIPKSLSLSNSIMSGSENYKQMRIILLVLSMAGILALILCFILGKKSRGFSAKIEKWRPFYNKLPIDLRVILFIIAGIVAFSSIYEASSQAIYVAQNPFRAVEIFIVIAVASCFWGLSFIQWKCLVPELKDWQNVKKAWEKGLLNKAGRSIKVHFTKGKRSLNEAFLNQSTGTQLFILLAIVFCLGLAALMMFVHPVFLLLYMILLGAIGIPLVMVLINRIGYFNRIVEKTNELALGNLGEDLEVSGRSVLATLTANINVLKQGVKTSQSHQAKSERLKTELITNVSHDLRTPLTSIITYTELLKTEDVSSEDRAAYLEIIDRKSKRLKVLIEDLFEVSKMASGNIELVKERVDLDQLLQQALAEYDETINESSLQFRVNNSQKPVYALVDGQKLWRVFDNLIGNILKYSLDHSRVYITISTLNDQAIIMFKNVSKYELSDNTDELFERFKRGDTSRHTEGSGLGLAIAKSIIDLHDGRLDIETDGDLFKVNITLKLEK